MCVCVCMYVCMCVCMYVCMHVCMLVTICYKIMKRHGEGIVITDGARCVRYLSKKAHEFLDNSARIACIPALPPSIVTGKPTLLGNPTEMTYVGSDNPTRLGNLSSPVD